MKIKSRISFIIIYLLSVFFVFAILIVVFKEQVFKNINIKVSDDTSAGISQSTIIDNTQVNGKKEVLDVLGLDFIIKHEGEMTIKCREEYRKDYINKGFENSDIMQEKGLIIKIEGAIKDIKPYYDGKAEFQKAILVLTTNGQLFSINLEDIKNNYSVSYKYTFDKKIVSLTTGKLQYTDVTKRSLAKLNDDSSRIITKKNILDDISKYELGKKVEIIPNTTKYIIIEDDLSVRIGDFKVDKYFSIEEEKWINKEADTSKYKYLSNVFALKYKVMDFEYVLTTETLGEEKYEIYNIFFITQEGELLLLRYSENQEINVSGTMIPVSIKLEKSVYKLELDKKETSKYGIKNIVFTDGTFVDFEETVKEYLEVK